MLGGCEALQTEPTAEHCRPSHHLLDVDEMAASDLHPNVTEAEQELREQASRHAPTPQQPTTSLPACTAGPPHMANSFWRLSATHFRVPGRVEHMGGAVHRGDRSAGPRGVRRSTLPNTMIQCLAQRHADSMLCLAQCPRAAAAAAAVEELLIATTCSAAAACRSRSRGRGGPGSCCRHVARPGGRRLGSGRIQCQPTTR